MFIPVGTHRRFGAPGLLQTARAPRPQLSAHPPARRGAILVWFVFVIPLMLLILLAVTDFAGASLAKIELKNAMDAAALSAIKTWHEQDKTLAVSDVEELCAANFSGSGILSRSAVASEPGQASSPLVTFGVLQDSGEQHVFIPVGDVEPAQAARCVAVGATMQVPSLGGAWLGIALGPYTVTAESYARISPEQGTPQLVSIDAVAAATTPQEGSR
uniref:Putative Flp pilus-assembly TadG-like N-terminal domain-containing protein n=1 Tax=Schlesneria paludicola TaxID=360056 RepID=A0A7C2JZ47_9PLAN